ncbi:MAG: hypothetical protein RMY16_22685 [Nostoc sp. DedQUE12b]|uniref:hypothetical protein n=1 Tax=Nostoc sp. DedQUE12b TaxID=3075398 RepID=UPI002AD43778|nr:hypothetical protein [Nostoc sp. DedQUE12b]MDZ8088342.1 hypothetical protein [Nostoc sp. DedQUE12b]
MPAQIYGKTPGTPITKTYIELLKFFLPRPVTSEEELVATQEVIDSLIDKGKLTPNEQDYPNGSFLLFHKNP